MNSMDNPNYDTRIPIPSWLIKGRRIDLPDGSMVEFTGKNDDDYCMIFKDKGDDFHVNFTIKPDLFELHTKDEETEMRNYHLKRYSAVIVDLVYHWSKKRPELVKPFSVKYWTHQEHVIDINSSPIPELNWTGGIYDLDPKLLPKYELSEEQVRKLHFSIGLLFNNHGMCNGMLLAHKKSRQLIRVDKTLLFTIFNTAVGLDSLKDAIIKDYKDYKAKTNGSETSSLL